MPDEASFTMTYTAYVLKDKAGRPELVEIDGNVCVGLFTDKAALQAFYNDKHGKNAQPKFTCFVFESAAVVVLFFETFKTSFDEEGIACVAVNPQPSVPPMYAPIRDFLEYLKTCD